MKLMLTAAIFVLSLSASAELRTVETVDLNRYAGTWYQISKNPLPFEAGCVCSVQKLSPRTDGDIGVENSCREKTVDGALKVISGVARSEDPSTNARFEVDFGLPRKGQYWIIALGDHYEYAVVSDPTERSLYILSKTQVLSANLYQEALAKAASQTDISKLEPTLQTGCVYP